MACSPIISYVMKKWSYKTLLNLNCLLQERSSLLIKGMISLEGNSLDLVIVYYINASEIWLVKRGILWWEWSDKRGVTV